MLKKLVAILLMVMLLTASALAAGKLSVTQENFHVVKDRTTYAYAYARVENVGDKPTKVNAGLLEIYDENGDTITSTDSLSAYGKYLQPDEYTYIKMSVKAEVESPAEVDDYLLTVSAKSDTSMVTKHLAVETEYLPNVQRGYYTYSYMIATITNDTEEAINNVNILLALLDDEDNILYIASDSIGNRFSLLPGSALEVRYAVDSTFLTYLEENSYTPTKVDAIAYVNVDAE